MKKGTSFHRGVCRVIDSAATNKQNLNNLKRMSDCDAIRKDWENVGKDIRTAAKQYYTGGR